MKTPLSLLKLIAATLLIAGSLGFLWHPDNDWQTWGGSYFYSEFNLAQLPSWLLFGPGGWYQTAATTIWWVFHTAPNVALLYLLATIFGILSIYAIGYIRTTIIRITLVTAIVLLYLYEFTILDISGLLPDASTTKVMIDNWRFGLGGTMFVYSGEITRNLLFLIPIAVILGWPPRLATKFSYGLPIVIIALFAGSVSWVLLKHRIGQLEILLPSPFATIVNAYKALGSAETPIKPSAYLGRPVSQVDKIVVVMDESVRAGFASTVASDQNATPFLASMAGRIADFGVASSAANCSITSRQSFRHMMRQEHAGLPIAPLLSRTTVWQYALQGGYETRHLDAFGSPVTLTSNMGVVERNFILHRDAFMDMPVYERDMTVARKLRAMLREPGKQFIFVEKYGVHVPYPHTHPPHRNPFKANTSLPFTLDVSAVEEMVRHYKNAINWSVDEFFRELLKEPLPDGTVLIYTSDHGQSLSEGGRKLSHCSFSGAMRMGEAAVPLLILSGNEGLNQRFIYSAAKNFNASSHYNLPSTILELMGFDPEWRQSEFDQSLLGGNLRHQQRLVRFGATAAAFQNPP
jgi:glucan phosphoethanolaminetransferase (alkaline phosphatase superfamily)